MSTHLYKNPGRKGALKVDIGTGFYYNGDVEGKESTRRRKLFTSFGYQVIIRLLDLPAFAFIIFGNHGLSDLGIGILGTLYWAFPLFVLGRCPLHVLAKWLFEGRKTGSLVTYLKKAYGKKFVLMVIFFASILSVLFWLVLRAV